MIVELEPSTLTITLSLNNLNILMKGQRMSGQIKYKTQLEAVYKKSTLYKDIDRLKVKGHWKDIPYKH